MLVNVLKFVLGEKKTIFGFDPVKIKLEKAEKEAERVALKEQKEAEKLAARDEKHKAKGDKEWQGDARGGVNFKIIDLAKAARTLTLPSIWASRTVQ